MNIPDYKVIKAMATYGGGFVQALAEAARRADALNLAKIKDTWSDEWEQYTAFAARRVSLGETYQDRTE